MHLTCCKGTSASNYSFTDLYDLIFFLCPLYISRRYALQCTPDTLLLAHHARPFRIHFSLEATNLYDSCLEVLGGNAPTTVSFNRSDRRYQPNAPPYHSPLPATNAYSPALPAPFYKVASQYTYHQFAAEVLTYNIFFDAHMRQRYKLSMDFRFQYISANKHSK